MQALAQRHRSGDGSSQDRRSGCREHHVAGAVQGLQHEAAEGRRRRHLRRTSRRSSDSRVQVRGPRPSHRSPPPGLSLVGAGSTSVRIGSQACRVLANRRDSDFARDCRASPRNFRWQRNIEWGELTVFPRAPARWRRSVPRCHCPSAARQSCRSCPWFPTRFTLGCAPPGTSAAGMAVSCCACAGVRRSSRTANIRQAAMMVNISFV